MLMEKDDMMHFLPYLLQDLWELGSNPKDFIDLLEKHVAVSETFQILDLACGKGAAAVKVAQHLQVKVTGIDLIPEFIEYAKQKAIECCVDAFCHFATGDIKKEVLIEKNYDCVILGSVGNVLGTPKETVDQLTLTVKPSGYILIYGVFLLDGVKKEKVRYKDDEYFTNEQWVNAFARSGLKLIEAIPNQKSAEHDANNKAIIKRADELIRIHPEKQSILENFVDAQLNGSYDLQHHVAGITWLLQAM